MLKPLKPEKHGGYEELSSRWADQLSRLAVGVGISWDAFPQNYLAEPFAATLAAWKFEHEPQSEFVSYLRESFCQTLEVTCGNAPEKLSGDSGKAFDLFMTCLIVLLRAWRSDPPPENVHGDVAAHWCESHPCILSEVQKSIRSRVMQPQVQKTEWTWKEAVAHKGNLPIGDKLELGMTAHLSGQRSWTQAARTAAYALFGDFLLRHTESIGFCTRCERPFQRGQKKNYCSLTCAHTNSASISRDKATREWRRKTFIDACQALIKWLAAGKRLRTNWPRDFQNTVPGFRTRDGKRPNQTLAAYIRASRTELGSPERQKLFQSLQDLDTISQIQKKTKSDWDVQPEAFDAFLDNIKKAEEQGKEMPRK